MSSREQPVFLETSTMGTIRENVFDDEYEYAKNIINGYLDPNSEFVDETFEYDGQAHSIYVSGAPSFASVTYSNNGKTDVGTYIVTATIKAANYETMTKTATLRITGKQITGVTFEDGSVENADFVICTTDTFHAFEKLIPNNKRKRN